jgi:hypothetical protein
VLENAEAAGRYVLLELKASKMALVGGKHIVIPETVKQDLAWVVVSIGPRAPDACALPLETGDRVVFQGGTRVAIGDRTFCCVDAGGIMLKLNRDVASRYFDGEDAPAILTSISEQVQ